MTILTVDDYPHVRAAIDASVRERDLPNSTIAAPIYHEAAEAELQRRVPDWASLTGLQAAALRRATIYYLASLLAPVAIVFDLENIGNWRGQRKNVSPGDRVSTLRGLVDQEVDLILGTEQDDDQELRPTMFAAAGPVRPARPGTGW